MSEIKSIDDYIKLLRGKSTDPCLTISPATLKWFMRLEKDPSNHARCCAIEKYEHKKGFFKIRWLCE